MMLNLGCGDNRLPAPWQNHDSDVDITRPLPWPDDSAEFIVIEHCVEHVTYYDAIAFFKECFRVLRIGGVLRVTVPSLTQIMNCRNQRYFDWLKERGWAPTADDRGAMHAILYCHGHKTAWNALLMEATLYFCGFNSPRKQRLGWSSHPKLCGVEGHARVIGKEFNEIESITFEAAKMTGDLSRDYDASFYAMHRGWQDEYESMAQVLVQHLPGFHSVLDIGCGNGYLITALEKMGREVTGYDGSSHVLEYRPDIVVADVTRPIVCTPRDLVICTEVAEHVEEQHADQLVDNVCRAARHAVFFSAAQAGHGGHLHVNEQPRKYWIDKFEARSFELDQATTDRIVSELRVTNRKTWWFANNCFVLRRVEQKKPLQVLLENAQLTDVPVKKVQLDQTVDWDSRPRVAVVLGGGERVWEDVDRAGQWCAANGMRPEFYATNDMIEHFPHPIVAVTLHPDKLDRWLGGRRNAARPMPVEVWSHDGGSRPNNPYVTHRLRDWGGSVGLFAYAVARKRGCERAILCGVPMRAEEGHFVRRTKWHAVSVFVAAWEQRRAEMLPHVRSVSGGLTQEWFGLPTAEWLQQMETADVSA